MKLCGILAVTEAANFLLGKVGEPYIGDYINHVSQYPNPMTAKHAILPDIHAIDYPTGRTVELSQQLKPSLKLSPSLPSLPAIHSTTSTELQLIQLFEGLNQLLLTTSQDFRTSTLDKHCAPDVVGDDNGGIIGAFESAQNQFHCGQAIPLCVGAFGEVNRDFTASSRY
eukprot:scaffold30993_cov50-Cyclotella_meneghiniana.AAC.5